MGMTGGAPKAASSVAELLEMLLHAVGHELRTPMNGIINTVALLKTEGDAAERALLFEGLEDSVERLSGTVERILEYAALREGALVAHPVDFQPSAALAAIAQRAKPLLRTRPDVRLAIEVLQPNIWIRADQERIEKATMELVRNAIQFGAPGTIDLSLEVPSDGRLIVEVRDEGPGIPLEHRENVFLPFMQVPDGPTRSHEGSGLGLSISRALMEKLGGTVELVPEDHGCCFRLIAPIEAGEAAPQLHTVGTRVLIVDDDRINRMVAKKLAVSLGCEVHLAEDGRQGVEVFETVRPDVVFMDVEMPVTNGLDATRSIRAFDGETPIVAVTAYTAEKDRDRCREAGMNSFLAKPLRKPEVESTLRRLVSRKSWVVQV